MGRNAVRISRQNVKRSYAVKLFLVLLSCFACVALSGVEAREQGCTYIPDSGGENIDVLITNEATGEKLADGASVPTGTRLRIDSVAEAYGTCYCPETGVTRLRTVNHTNVSADIWADGIPAGHYTLGYVFGRYPRSGGGTAFWQVLDTTAPNSTGPVYYTPPRQGTYALNIQAVINTTSCNIQPGVTEMKRFTIVAY